MTKEELQIKEKLSLVLTKKNELIPQIYDLFQKLNNNRSQYILNSYSSIVDPLKKIIKTPNILFTFNDEQRKIDIFQTDTENKKELISTILIYNFPYQLDSKVIFPPSLKIQNFNSNNTFNIEKQNIDKFQVWWDINNFLYKNESKILTKVNSLHKRHKKIYFKLNKKLNTLANQQDKLSQKKIDILFPLFLKDLKKGIKLNLPHLGSVPFEKFSLKNIIELKQISKTTFLITTYDPSKKITLNHKVETNNPKEIFKTHFFPYILNEISFPLIYSQLLKNP